MLADQFNHHKLGMADCDQSFISHLSVNSEIIDGIYFKPNL